MPCRSSESFAGWQKPSNVPLIRITSVLSCARCACGIASLPFLPLRALCSPRTVPAFFCSVCSASEPIFVPKDSCHLLLVILSSFMMAFSLRVYCVFTVPSVVCAGATAPVSVSIYSLIFLLLTSPHVLCRSIYFMQSAHSSQVFVCLLVFHIVLFRICLFPPHVPLSCTKGFLRDSLSVSSFVPSSILVGS